MLGCASLKATSLGLKKNPNVLPLLVVFTSKCRTLPPSSNDLMS